MKAIKIFFGVLAGLFALAICVYLRMLIVRNSHILRALVIFAGLYILAAISLTLFKSAFRKKEECSGVPSWLEEPAISRSEASSQLAASREEMYKALELYHSHVKHVISILFAFLAAISGILAFAPKVESILPQALVLIVVAILLIAVLPFGVIAQKILRRYYEVYVSALVFAVRIHMAVELHLAHSWFIRTIEKAHAATSDMDFLMKRSKSIADTFFLYSLVLWFFSVVSVILGVLLLFWAYELYY